jgi:hypothetical protein
MKTGTLLSLAAVTAVPVAIGLFWSQSAQSQINAAPSWVPIGVSQSGSSSTVWFHEPSSRQALACQTTGSGAGAGVHCVTAKLP